MRARRMGSAILLRQSARACGSYALLLFIPRGSARLASLFQGLATPVILYCVSCIHVLSFIISSCTAPSELGYHLLLPDTHSARTIHTTTISTRIDRSIFNRP